MVSGSHGALFRVCNNGHDSRVRASQAASGSFCLLFKPCERNGIGAVETELLVDGRML